MKKIASLLIIILIGVAIDADAKKKARKFYLTQTQFTGSQALTACAKKFHMASLWEIFDPSNLRYDTNLGVTRDDAGFGPPNGARGWIRTGFDTEGIPVPGAGNCFTWTSDSDIHFGSVVGLSNNWEGQSVVTSPWGAGSLQCNLGVRVWCVQD